MHSYLIVSFILARLTITVLILFTSILSWKTNIQLFPFSVCSKKHETSEDAHSLTGFVSIFKAGSCDAAALQAIERVRPPTCSGRILYSTHMSLHQRSRDLLLHSRELLWERKEIWCSCKKIYFWRLTASISYSQLLYTEKKKKISYSYSHFESNKMLTFICVWTLITLIS